MYFANASAGCVGEQIRAPPLIMETAIMVKDDEYLFRSYMQHGLQIFLPGGARDSGRAETRRRGEGVGRR